ncbi:MAG: DUF5695 domain-containing protein [Armatimonadetes bacterium]|nr:DUF5695 domain-containing protein [Armatimonadota bacterium]
MRIASIIISSILLGAISTVSNAQNATLSNSYFDLSLDQKSGGLASIKRPNDAFDTNYVNENSTIGDTTIRYWVDGGEWAEASTASSEDSRQVSTSPGMLKVDYLNDSADHHGIKAFSLEETYALKDGGLTWTMRFKNKTSHEIELGDIAIPMNFATSYRDCDPVTVFTKRVIRHSFISGDASFMFVERCNGAAPYLVMTPMPGTHLEYFSQRGGPYTVYIHAKVRALNLDTTFGDWRLPITSKTIAPKGKSGDEVVYAFKFQWAKDYDDVRNILVKEGLISVNAVPGMVLPQKMPAMFSLTTKQKINSIKAEFPKSAKIKLVGKKPGPTYVYKIELSKLGENILTVDYGKGAKLYLEYFCTQPAETLIQKRSAFIINKQQIKDPSKWYDGLFSIWDMKAQVLRNPDNNGGLQDYIVGGSDDPTNCKAPYVALKNVSFPVQSEIDSLEYYAERFLWGGLQRKDTEFPYPYGIYGIDNWYMNRNSLKSVDSKGTGPDHLWRGYDYPAIFYFYLNMYKIAKLYPDKTKYLDAKGYLERAFGTAKAFFDVAYGVKGYWGEYTDYTMKTGIYNELCLPELIDTLYTEGRKADADWLKNEWEKKVKYFVFDDPYPYISEYPFDTTAYESTHAIAKYGLEHDVLPDQNLWQDKNSGVWYSHPKVSKNDFRDFMQRETAANIADRGWLETTYYSIGSDIRAGGNATYSLSYMTQMGGWSILDYALYFSEKPEEYLRLGYASYLGSWALINAGDKASNYGYWFPGPENDGAAGWAYEPQKIARPWYGLAQGRGIWSYDGEIDHGFMGGLRCAATIVVKDPIFGLFAYGGGIAESKDSITIIPMDGIRQSLHLLNVNPKLNMQLERDGFNKVIERVSLDGKLKNLSFEIENRTSDAHETKLSIRGLPTGDYQVSVNGSAQVLNITTEPWSSISLKIPSCKAYRVEIAGF